MFFIGCNRKKMRTNNLAFILFATLFLAFAFIPFSLAEMDYHSTISITNVAGSPSNGITTNVTHIFVNDYTNDRIYIYLADGTYVSYFGTAATGNADVAGLTNDGTYIYAFDNVDQRVYKYLMDGTYDSYFVVTGGVIGISYVDGKVWIGGNKAYGYMRQYWANNGTYIRQATVAAWTSTSFRSFYITPTEEIISLYSTGTGYTANTWYKGYLNATLHPYSPVTSLNYGEYWIYSDIDCDGTWCYTVQASGGKRIFKYYQNTTVEPVNITYTVPRKLTSPGTYVLQAPCSSSLSDYLFYFYSDNITFDGQNHLITHTGSTGTFYSLSIPQHLNNLTLKNIYIRPNNAARYYGFLNGNPYTLSNSNISNITFHPSSLMAGTTYGIFYVYFNNSNIEKITFPNKGYSTHLPLFRRTITNSNISELNINYNSSYANAFIFYEGLVGTNINNSNITTQHTNIFQSTITNSTLTNSNLRTINGTTQVFFNGAITGTNISGNTFTKTTNGPMFTTGLNGTNSLIYNNLFKLNASGTNIETLAVGNDIAFNTTNSTGPNIIGGLYLGGNYYYSDSGTGFSQTCIDGDSDGFCDTNYTFGNSIDYLPLSSSFKLFSSSDSWHNNTIEYVDRNFTIVAEVDTAFISSPSAKMEYNGTNYTMSKYLSGVNVTFYYNLKIPAVTATYNETRLIKYYILDSGGNLLGSENDTQLVYRINLTKSTTLTTQVLNITCIDEVTGALVANCNLNPTFSVWDDRSYNRSGYYRTFNLVSSAASYYLFYKYPNVTVSNFTTDITASVYSSGYPLRSFYFSNYSINGTASKINLYLLDSASGIYTTFNVIDGFSGAALSNAHIVGTTTTLLGATLIACEGYTDAAGTLTCWHNPNTEHTYVFSKAGYSTYTYVIYPTQTSYTVTMGSGAGINMTHPMDSINYSISPELTLTLQNGTDYLFWFNLSSSNSSLNSYGFLLYGNYNNGTQMLLCNETGTDPDGENLSCLANTANYSSMSMNHYFTNYNGTIGATATWTVHRYFQGDYSIRTFFDDLKIFLRNPAFGNGTDAGFTLALILFAILLLMVGYLSYVSGVYSPFAIAGVIAAYTGFMSYMEVMPMQAGWILGHWTITFFIWIVLLAYLILEHTK